MTDRRDVLKAGAAAAGLAAFAAGYEETARKVVAGVAESLAPRPAGAAPNIHGRSLPPEAVVDPATGEVAPNPAQYVAHTACLGCTTLCGVRVRVDRAANRVLRVSGNPYSPLSADPPLAEETSIRESFAALSRQAEKGLAGRATACGRGAAVLSQIESPHRVLQPLKRVGPRGGGRWVPIPFEQLVEEVVEGGDLFGEGPVEGLRAIRGDAPLDPQAPELGPRSNRLAVLFSVVDGRDGFARRFLTQAYGSINLVGHGAYCGGAMRSGSGAVFDNFVQMPHTKPDIADAEFVVFCGTAPANAGNPFKRQGMQLAKARRDGGLEYVVVDPVIGHSDAHAARERGRWIPIRPATDGAFAMALIRRLLETQGFNAAFLAQPGPRAAQKAGEAGWTNATHLVIAEPGHPREGRFLRGSDLGLAHEGPRYGAQDPFVARDAATGALVRHGAAEAPALLFVDARLDVAGTPIRLRSSLDLLRESAMALTVAGYAAICGIPEETIVALADKLARHGRKAVVNTHGGMMAGNGFSSAFALLTVNTLLGNINRRGGAIAGGGKFPDDGPGPRYDLADLPGRLPPRGVQVSRNVAYERTSEYRRKAASGRPYPAEAPWYPNAPDLGTEAWASIVSGYPYALKAVILWAANPLYGVPGLAAQAKSALADPKRLPLFVAVDPFVNETNAYADYIVPDTLLYENWGWAMPWAGVPVRTSTARWPVVEPRTAKTAEGEAICMESFLIALARRMGLAGFGAGAIKAADGRLLPLDTPADWYLRGGANIAYAAPGPVPDATGDDIALTGLDRMMPVLERTLTPEEARKVAFVLARGGRMEKLASAFGPDGRARLPLPRPAQLYNEALGTSRDAMTGARFPGTAAWSEPRFADGSPARAKLPAADWPLLLVSQKSVLMNAYSIGADRLRGLHPENPVAIHPEDAAPLGIRTGDRIRIATAGGEAVGTAILRRGVMRGVVEFGARGHEIAGRRADDRPELAAGVNLNELGIPDPTRRLGPALWLDPVAGTSARQGLPARVTRA